MFNSCHFLASVERLRLHNREYLQTNANELHFYSRLFAQIRGSLLGPVPNRPGQCPSIIRNDVIQDTLQRGLPSLFAATIVFVRLRCGREAILRDDQFGLLAM